MSRRPFLSASLALALMLFGSSCALAPQKTGETEQTSAQTEQGSPVGSEPRSNSGLVSVPIQPLPGFDNANIKDHELATLAGWTIEGWANVPDASAMVWTTEGDMLVSSPATGSVYRLHYGQDFTKAPSAKILVNGLVEPYALGIGKVESQTVLVIGQKGKITTHSLDGDQVGPENILVDELPADGLHPRIQFTISPDGGAVYYSIGSATDQDLADRYSAPQRGVIKMARLDGSQDNTGKSTVAIGARYAGGLDFAPDNILYAAVSGVDEPAYPHHAALDGKSDGYGLENTSWAASHPVDIVTSVPKSADFGWPYCVPDAAGGPDTPYSAVNVSFVPDPRTNEKSAVINCSLLERAQSSVPAHSNPTSLQFLLESSLPSSLISGAIVVANGAAQPPIMTAETPTGTGTLTDQALTSGVPAVYYLRWSAETSTLSAPTVWLAGFQDSSGNVWGRPVDASTGPGGKLYVTDATNGVIYRLTPIAG